MSELRRVTIDGTTHAVDVSDGRFEWIDGRTLSVDDVTHASPVVPTKMICVHLNYRSRLDELQRKQPPAPTYFWKSISALNGHRGKVVRPANCQFLNYEGEFVLVVGRTTRNITPDEAKDHIWGYTVANDLGLHDFRDTDENSMVRVKSSDTLAPIGPGLVTDWDFRDKQIRTRVDGRIVQEDNTNGLLWDPHYILADLARSITFERGDMILTGTPANSRPVAPGSTVTVEVEGLGTLENQIVAAEREIARDFGAQPGASDAIKSIALGSDFRK